MSWSPEYTPTFRRDYKNLGSEIQRRVDEAIKEILKADDPRKLGRAKYGRWRGGFGYDLGRANRVIYYVDSKRKTVIFLRCGPHSIY